MPSSQRKENEICQTTAAGERRTSLLSLPTSLC
jgi:hypothetical protein